jgi:hypothetical protein
LRTLYNFRVPWGDVGLGLMTGVIGLSTLEEASYDYDLVSFPVALEGRVRMVSSLWSAGLGLSTGFLISRISLHSGEPSEILASSIFLSPSLGVWLRVSDRMSVNADLGFLAVFFTGTPFTGLSLGMGVEYAFGRQ